MKKFCIFLLVFFGFCTLNAQLLINNNCDKTPFTFGPQVQDSKIDMKNLYFHKATGKLNVRGPASTSQFEVYFVLPIAFREQAPIWLDIQCSQMIDYRFVRLDAFNTFVAARLNNYSGTINLDWTSWTLIKKHDYSRIPPSVPMPAFNELPDSVKPYLKPTGCVQWEDPFVKGKCDSIWGHTNDLIVLANRIKYYCYCIPWNFPTSPMSFDAFYAMKWGNSCTGHAHAGAAIFRANGVPSRILMNMPLMNNFDMHWIIEYYIPQYGWVKMETSGGISPYVNAHQEIITFACNPEDEFSMTFPDNIESYWFTSDPVFQHNSPNWAQAHSASQLRIVSDTSYKIDQIISLTDSVYRYFTTYKGINLTSGQNYFFQIATGFQYKAFNHINNGMKDSLIYYLNQSLDNYRNIELKPLNTIFFDNFENGINGWSHGGVIDEWEIGTPSNVGPPIAYSGNNCWGTDLDSVYENNADCWLLSPSINLNNLACAYLNLKIWNDVDDYLQSYSPKDRLWIELTTDGGSNFIPITTHLGGVIDYNTGIPKVPGWSRLVLDLTPFVKSTIKLRFRFTSDATVSRPGSYIDDVHIYGREMGTLGVNEIKTDQNLFKIFPNPATNKICIYTEGPLQKNTMISIFNIQGDKVLSNTIMDKNSMDIDVSFLAKGVYVVEIQSAKGVTLKKLVIQ